MTSIFINYRRDDTKWAAVSLAEKLSKVYGKEAVFLDVEGIEAGVDFPDALQAALERADVLLVLIGAKWLTLQGQHGKRRIDHPDDWVRREIRHALESKTCRVIPVIVDDGDLPDDASALPDDIAQLVKRQRVAVRSERASIDLRPIIDAIGPGEKPASCAPSIDPLQILHDSGQLAPHVYPRAIVRKELLDQLHEAMRNHGAVTVGGLSGSGKTYLMASYLAQRMDPAHVDKVFWHEAAEGQTVEDLLAQFNDVIPVASASASARCNQLLRLLSNRKGLLIVDDWQKAGDAYTPLINAASRIQSPCRLVLLSQKRVEPSGVAEPPYHLDVTAWGCHEVEQLLRANQLAGLQHHARDIVRVSGGLPFAVSLFCSLVSTYNYAPDTLLDGVMSEDSRLKDWFDKIVKNLSLDAKSLLPRLGLVDGPFNIGVVRALMAKACDDPFQELQRSYLVTRATEFRWRMHDLAASFSRVRMSDEEAKTVHEQLGKHFARKLLDKGKREFSELEFIEAVRGYRHLRQSGAATHGEELLLRISGTAKRRGLYRLYADLCALAIADLPNRDRWFDYHHAHCLLILGFYAESLKLVEALRTDGEVKATPRLALSVDRLYAEALGALGREQEGLDVLLRALDVYRATEKASVPYSHANSILVWLHLRMGNLDEAERLNNVLLAENMPREERRGTASAKAKAKDDEKRMGAASALAKYGMILARRGNHDVAKGQLGTALNLFEEIGDKRGMVWCLSHLSEVHLQLTDEATALDYFNRARRLAADIDECSVDYLDVVTSLRARAGMREFVSMLDDEWRRIHGMRGAGRTARPGTKARRHRMA